MRTAGPIVFAICGFAAAGCTPGARISLVQPHLGGAEQRLELEASQAAFTGPADGMERYRLSFPLPGASSGQHYLVYLCLPAEAGRHAIGESLPQGGFVAGFFIQVSGRNKGLSEFVSGTAETQRVTAAPAHRRLRLRLKCADGSQIEGEALAVRDDRALREFEQYERPGDVQPLLRATRPATAAGIQGP